MGVLSAECYGTVMDIFEREILLHMRDANPCHPGREHITQLVDTFEHTGPNDGMCAWFLRCWAILCGRSARGSGTTECPIQ